MCFITAAVFGIGAGLSVGALGLGVAGTGLSVAGAASQAKYQGALAREQAKVGVWERQAAEAAGGGRAALAGLESRRISGRQLAVGAATGFDPSTGDIAALIQETREAGTRAQWSAQHAGQVAGWAAETTSAFRVAGTRAAASGAQQRAFAFGLQGAGQIIGLAQERFA